MSEPTETPSPTPEPETPEVPDATDNDDLDVRAKDKIAKANNEAKNLRQRVKELEPLAQQLREIKEAEKSETQKLSDALETERNARALAERSLLQHEVAADKGVPPKLARLLSGDTREAIEEAADVLLSELSNGNRNDRAPTRVASGRPSNPDDELDPLDYISKLRSSR